VAEQVARFMQAGLKTTSKELETTMGEQMTTTAGQTGLKIPTVEQKTTTLKQTTKAKQTKLTTTMAVWKELQTTIDDPADL